MRKAFQLSAVRSDLIRGLLLLVMTATPGAGQISQVNGTISGVVSDPTGSPIANASLKARSATTAFERDTTSNTRGEYQVPLLPLGTYTITVSAPGFKNYEQSGIGVRLDAASEVNELQEQFGNNFTEHRTTPLNFFAEDHYRVSPSLTLSYGLRWEYRFIPSLNQNAPLAISRNLPNDGHNFASRFGFSYMVTPKTVLRGGYGIFYDTLNLRNISLVDRSNGAQVTTYVINGNVAGAPQYPAAFSGPLTDFAAKPTAYGFAPTFKTQYAEQANLQAERELAKDLALTVGLQWYGGHNEPLLLDSNLGAPVRSLADGRPVFSSANRPNPNYNQIFDFQSVGNSVYYGGFINLAKRFSHQFQLVGSYTLGWAFNENDSVGDNGSNVINPTNLRDDHAFSSSDQRHRFVIQGVWQPRLAVSGWQASLMNGWTLAPNVTITSGFPYTAVSGSDLNGDGVNNDYPVYGARNSYRGPWFQEVNLRVSRNFPLYRERVSLEIIGEAENLLNSTNAACTTGGCGGAINTTYGPTMAAPPINQNFGQLTSAFNSRQIQIGARLRF